MMRNAGLGAKIGTGFLALLIIMGMLGGMAIFSMGQVERQADWLKNEYMPQLQVASDLLQNMWFFQYNLRGYIMAFNEDYHNNATVTQPKIFAGITKALDLADKSPQLNTLRASTEQFKNYLNEYTGHVPEVEAAIAGITQARGEITQAGAMLLENAQTYYNNQHESLLTDIAAGAASETLKERASKCMLITEVMNIANSMQVRCWTGQATRNTDLLESTIPDFDVISAKVEEIRGITRQEANLQQLAKIQESLNRFKGALESALNNSTTLASLNSAMMKTGQKARETAQDTAAASVGKTNTIAETTYQKLRLNIFLMIGGLAGALVLSIVLAILIVLSITRPINLIISSLTAVSGQTSGAASEMAGTSESLSSSATEQAAISEETASSIEEIQSQSAQLAELTNGAAEMMKENIRRSGESLKALIEMTQRMAQIEKDSGEMGKIIKTIDEIAFQTNLLALNAAVEAARAGDAGKGFAVVAEEVRALAARAAEAARVTQELLEGTATRVKETSTAIRKINDNFESIVETATEMGDKLEQVTAANGEVAQGIEQINRAGQQSSQAAQSVAANSEEMSATAEELSAQAYELGDVVIQLRSIIQGGKTAGAAASLQTTRASHEDMPRHPAANHATSNMDAAQANNNGRAQSLPTDRRQNSTATHRP